MAKVRPTIPHYIQSDNLSTAWAEAFVPLMSSTGDEIVPLLTTITGFKDGVPAETPALRQSLDACLASNDEQSVHTVSNTIFPQSIWKRAKGNRQKLYDEYLENLPVYVQMAPSKNRQGLYFSRLIAFAVDPVTGKHNPTIPIGKLPGMGNQLEFILDRCKKGVRKSMFQAAIFDPARDHVGGAQQGFPCLQHLTFVPDFSDGTLQVNAFYATQQLFVKAYGNLLGLSRLGAFVAEVAGLQMAKLSCFVGVEKMDKRPKANAELTALKAAAEACLASKKDAQG